MAKRFKERGLSGTSIGPRDALNCGAKTAALHPHSHTYQIPPLKDSRRITLTFFSKTVLMQYQIIVYHFVIDTVCLFKPVLHIEMNRRFYLYPRQTALRIPLPIGPAKGNRPFKRNTANSLSQIIGIYAKPVNIQGFPAFNLPFHTVCLRHCTGQMRRRSCTLPPKRIDGYFLYLQRNILHGYISSQIETPFSSILRMSSLYILFQLR